MFKKLLNLFFGSRYTNTGALIDERTPEQLAGAYDSREIILPTPVQWLPKTTWKRYPVKRQYYTLQCVPESITKHLGIHEETENGTYVDLSPEFFYTLRVNKPSGGMMWNDAMKIATTIGACLDGRLRQRFREEEPEEIPTIEMYKEALKYRGRAYIDDKERSMDSIARIIDKVGSCLIWFWFDEAGREYWQVVPRIMFPTLGTYDRGATRHAVLAVDYGIRNGRKVIKIDDSAGNNSAENDQDRFIDEDFLKRCYVSGYVIDLPNVVPVQPPQTTKPKWSGKRNLSVGMSGNDVKELQDILRHEGLFTYPTSTGYLGGITRASIIKLQDKYGSEILQPVGLTKGTGLVFASTRKWLEKNFS